MNQFKNRFPPGALCYVIKSLNGTTTAIYSPCTNVIQRIPSTTIWDTCSHEWLMHSAVAHLEFNEAFIIIASVKNNYYIVSSRGCGWIDV